VFQYFYHCCEEELPIRDIRDRHKTEPHYENLTENWCNSCMNSRIKSANQKQVKYLFLVTRYRKHNHKRDGKLLVVGFLYRAEEKVWCDLSQSRTSGVEGYKTNDPKNCGFFAGDETQSHFVSAENAFVKDKKNGRWIYFADEAETREISVHLKKSPNILQKLREKAKELTTRTNQKQCETRKDERRCKSC